MGLVNGEEQAAVMTDPTPAFMQYRFPGAERLLELYPIEMPASLAWSIPMEPAIAFARTKASEAVAASCTDPHERARLYSIIEEDRWIQPTSGSIAFSLSLVPEGILRSIYEKSDFGRLKSAAETAVDLAEALKEYRGKQLSIDIKL